jgi:translocation and assembly module TamB
MSRINHDESGFSKPSRKKRFRKRKFLLIGLVVLLVAIGFGVPYALQNRELVVSLINQNAGIRPMRVDLDAIEGGWMRPIKVRGLRLIDDKGAELVKVAEIETELNLLRLATNRSNLRTITIRGAEAVVDVQPGTTNLEEAIKPLLTSTGNASSSSSTSSSSSSSLPLGRLRIQDAILHARDSVDLTAWDLKVSEADVPFPTSEQPIPPVTLVGLLQQTASLPGESLLGGQFTVRTQPVPNASAQSAGGIVPMKMNISTNGLPLQWFSLAKRRFPDIPIERMMGLATIQADIDLNSNKHIVAQVQTAQLDSLRIIAPDLVGKRGAGLQRIRLSGNVQLNQDRLLTQNAILQCDVGALEANADLPWPIEAPTLSQPWIRNAEWNMRGNVNLAQVIQVAPDLIQMQDQVQLVSGTASVTAIQKKASQSLNPSTPPESNYRLQLGGLQANVNGTAMRWDQALQASVDVGASSTGQPSFKADVSAEFCKIEGAGDLQEGQLTGQFDLAKMEQRLSQWFALPVESLSGSAECNVVWKQDAGNRLAANGKLKTTPVRIVNQYGQLDEPAWDGDFSLITGAYCRLIADKLRCKQPRNCYRLKCSNRSRFWHRRPASGSCRQLASK